jgi:hypothetical protein
LKYFSQGCQYPQTPSNKFTIGLTLPYEKFSGGLPNYMLREKHFAITLKNLKLKIENQNSTDSLKKFQRVIS